MTDRSVVVRLRLNISDFSKGTAEAAVESRVLRAELEGVDKRMGSVEKSSSGAGKQIDKLSGRIALLGSLAASLGPALIPIGAIGIPAVAGLAQEFGFAALAGGSLLAASQGVGTAIKALEKARLDPTVENLQAAHEAMAKLGPDAREFARHVQDFLPMLRDIRDSAAAGWFPGLTDALDSFQVLGPKVADIFERIGHAGGELVADGAKSLTSSRWMPFLDFIEHEAPKAITDLGHTVGDLAHGLAELWMAFSPLNNDFSKMLRGAATDFDNWATKLSGTNGFREFVDYIHTTGPVVGQALASIANAILQIIEAAAPLGGPTLKILADVADVIAKLADSDLGTPLVAIASLTATVRLLGKAADGLAPRFAKAGAAARTFGADVKVASFGSYQEMEKAKASATRLGTQFKSLAKTGAVMGGITLAASGATDSVGLTNTTLLGMSGLMLGGWGAAVGTGIGLFLDLRDAADSTYTSLGRIGDVVRSNDLANMEKLRASLQTKADSWQGMLNWQGSGAAARSGVQELDEAINHLGNGQKIKGLSYLFGQSLSNSVDHADQSLQQFTHTFVALDNLLARRGSLIAYEQALDDLSKSIKDNGNAWDVGTEKGRANQIAANTLTQQAIARAQLLKKQGDSAGAGQVLGRAIANLKDFAGGSKAADKALEPLIRHLEKLEHKHPKPTLDADGMPLHEKTKKGEKELDHLDKKHPKPKLDADHRILMGKVLQGDQWLIALNNRKAIPHIGADDDELKGKVGEDHNILHKLGISRATPKINADASGAFGVFSAVRNAINALDGATAVTHVRTVRDGAPGPQLADGGTIPGARYPYADKTLMWGAPGEEVITNRNGQADAFRADRASGRIPAYGNGGAVGPQHWNSGRHVAGGRGVVERVIERLPQGRVTAHIHGFGDVALQFVQGVAQGEIAEHERREDVQAGR